MKTEKLKTQVCTSTYSISFQSNISTHYGASGTHRYWDNEPEKAKDILVSRKDSFDLTELLKEPWGAHVPRGGQPREPEGI